MTSYLSMPIPYTPTFHSSQCHSGLQGTNGNINEEDLMDKFSMEQIVFIKTSVMKGNQLRGFSIGWLVFRAEW